MIGPEIEHFELLEAVQLMESVPESEVASIAAEVRGKWCFTGSRAGNGGEFAAVSGVPADD